MRTPSEIQTYSHLCAEQNFIDIDFAVSMEVYSQLQKWGEQNHPDFVEHPLPTDPERRFDFYGVLPEEMAKDACEKAFINGQGSYAHIFVEEVCEAIGAEDEDALMAELVQVAAVTINWMRCIKRRQQARGEWK